MYPSLRTEFSRVLHGRINNIRVFGYLTVDDSPLIQTTLEKIVVWWSRRQELDIRTLGSTAFLEDEDFSQSYSFSLLPFGG